MAAVSVVAGLAASPTGGDSRQLVGKYDSQVLAKEMASASSTARVSPEPETEACIRAPPISSSVVCSPMTISAMRGEPRYMDALPSTMNTASQKLGMYAPPAAEGPNRQHTWGTRPDSRTWL